MFDRAEFDSEMERLKEIPCLMNDEWEYSELMDKVDAENSAKAESESSSKRDWVKSRLDRLRRY